MTVHPVEIEAMHRAIALASRAHPHPNPRVGAVLIDSTGGIIAEGFHERPGENHAERAALTSRSAPVPSGSTLVVTLEPCSHHGRTPPCTDAILDAGIQRVVVGAVDPDARNRGKGVDVLRAAGVTVETGVLAAEVEAADPAYFHHRRLGRPLVTLKTAMTLDGQTAAQDGTSQWITSARSREDAHRLRAENDAIVVGAATLRTDDPMLTVRSDGWSGRQPVAVVVAGAEPLPSQAHLWERTDTLVLASRPVEAPVEVIEIPPGEGGFPDLAQAALALADRGFLAVLVEGGARLASSFWDAGLVDRGVSYVGARIAGGVGVGVFGGDWSTFAASRAVRIESARTLGDDLRIDWQPVRE